MNYAMTLESPGPRARRWRKHFAQMATQDDERPGHRGENHDEHHDDGHRHGRPDGRSHGRGRGRGRSGWEGPFGPGFGGPPPFRGGFGPGGTRGNRRDRGDVRAAVLLLLEEQPRHGYEIITEITDRSEGTWRLSPGSVYPVLKSLTKKGLVRPEERDGKKVFHLTEAGAELVEERREAWGQPWAARERPDNEALTALWTQARQLAMSVWQVADGGDESQQLAVAAVLAETKKRIYLTLAGETDAEDSTT